MNGLWNKKFISYFSFVSFTSWFRKIPSQAWSPANTNSAMPRHSMPTLGHESTSPNVMTRATSCHCSAMAALASVGVWTRMAMKSLAPRLHLAPPLLTVDHRQVSSLAPKKDFAPGSGVKNRMAPAVGWFITQLRRRCDWLLCFYSFFFLQRTLGRYRHTYVHVNVIGSFMH